MTRSKPIGVNRSVLGSPPCGALTRKSHQPSINQKTSAERPAKFVTENSPLGQARSFAKAPHRFLSNPFQVIDPASAKSVHRYLEMQTQNGITLPMNTPQLTTKSISKKIGLVGLRRPLMQIITPDGTTYPKRPLTEPHFALLDGKILFTDGKTTIANLSENPTDETIIRLADTLESLAFVSSVNIRVGENENQTLIRTFFSYRGQSLFPFARLIKITSINKKEDCLSFELLGYDGTPIEAVIFLRATRANVDAIGHFVRTGEVLSLPDVPFEIALNTFDPQSGKSLSRRISNYLSLLSLYPDD